MIALRVLLTSLLMLIIIVSCHKKTAPTVTTRSIDIEAPTPIASNFVPDTLAGKSLYSARCGRCHGLPDIAQYNEKRWSSILPSMIPRAGLSKEEGMHVTAYVKQRIPH